MRRFNTSPDRIFKTLSNLISTTIARRVSMSNARRVLWTCIGIVPLCVTLLVAADETRAQDLDNVTLSGHVADQNGAVIPGASVTAKLTSTGIERTVATDAEGRFRIVELEPGTYTLRASSAGFASEEKTNVVTLAGQHLRLDFALLPAGVVSAETITSYSDAPSIDATRTLVGATLTRRELEALPIGSRSPLELVFTLGNITEEPLSTRDVAEDRDPAARSSIQHAATTPEEAGTFALAGGAASSNNITIDGLDNNDDRAARERFEPSLEAIEEVQVITNQFSAEYGRASGGRVNLRTRGGAHDLRGRLFYFFRDESLDANTFNNNRRGLKRLPLQQHNAGFTLGGPLSLTTPYSAPSRSVARARTFFFVAYELDTTLDSTLIDTLVPVAQHASFPLPAPTTLAGRRLEASATAPNAPAELAPLVAHVSTPARRHVFTARIDHNYNDMHNATFLYQRGRARDLRQFGGGLRLADALQGQTRHTDAISYTDNLVFSSTIVHQLRAQVSRLAPAANATRGGDSHNDRPARPVVLIDINDTLDADDADERSGTLVAGSSTSGASERRETRWQIQNSLTILGGAHTAKFGGDVQRIRSTFDDRTDASGTYNFASAADFLASMPSRFRQRFETESVQTNLYAGFFAQGEWRVRPNLTLSYGLRYERETILRDRNNFAPRLGVAYAPGKTGATVLRFGAGVFYNRALLRTIDDFTLGQQLIEFDTHTLPSTERRAFIAAHLRFPAALAANSPVVQEFGARLTNFSRRLEPHLRIPESYQFNAGIEREVAGAFVVEANFTWSRGLHLWREFNANAPVLPRGYSDFAAYLASRDFANFRRADGSRPLYDAATAGELVRFTLTPADPLNTESVGRTSESGVPVSLINLNSINSNTALDAALAAVNALRPDSARGQIEQLAALGNSFYRGLTLEARRRLTRGARGFAYSFRAAYTLSHLVDDGIVNTSSALRVGDFRAERARSLLDRRHRFVFSGTLDAPRSLALLGGLRVSHILRVASGAPFNISIGGTDRNLDDVNNDRPIFKGDARLLAARRRGDALDAARLLDAFALPTIGQTGNLPRNAGRGLSSFMLDINLTREFRFGGERRMLRPVVEIDNVLNKTVHTFGAEFINFDALRPSATPAQRQAFLDSFLVPTRTLRPRRIRLGLRFDF